MTTLRAAFVLLLTASATMPYAASALCSVLHPEMSDPRMGATHHGALVTAEGSASSWCDFGDCATAPVAPVATFVVSSMVVPIVDMALSLPTVGPDIDPTAPLTPPPIA